MVAHLCITGFLPGDNEDTSLKYELKVSPVFEQSVVSLLGHKSLNTMASGEWLLTKYQAAQISAVIGKPVPLDLDVFIGVET
ncbi:hypothetical protein GIW70_14155 [Pseudomonas syringae]|nr:hypothetical protein [Pseudomonas syringae]MCF5069329.1 hypothetical protein [Pseudomonas syringae]